MSADKAGMVRCPTVSTAVDDLVRDMTEILTSFCARLYGKRAAANRAARMMAAAESR